MADRRSIKYRLNAWPGRLWFVQRHGLAARIFVDALQVKLELDLIATMNVKVQSSLSVRRHHMYPTADIRN
jgi:hypothetical protein